MYNQQHPQVTNSTPNSYRKSNHKVKTATKQKPQIQRKSQIKIKFNRKTQSKQNPPTTQINQTQLTQSGNSITNKTTKHKDKDKNKIKQTRKKHQNQTKQKQTTKNPSNPQTQNNI